jgi:protein SCO1/2
MIKGSIRPSENNTHRMKYNPIKKILILVTILAVPGFLYYLLQEKGKNRYKPLAIYGQKKIAPTFHSVRGKQIPDTIYHTLPQFKLVNYNADTVTLNSYKGKIVLANLFYVKDRPQGIDLANKAMATFAKTYQQNKIMQFVGISIDPLSDTQAVLSKFQQNNLPHLPKWDLLTGDTAQIKNLVKNGLMLDAFKTIENGKPKFIFNNMFVLIDSQHRVRGYYEATNQEALSKLDDEIKVLIAEELRNMRDGR